MTSTTSENHDAWIALLWELKAAWQTKTGQEVLLTNLLLDRRELDKFLTDAAATDDDAIRAIVARIVARRSSAGTDPLPDLETFRSTAGGEPSGQGVANAKSRFDIVRAGAGLVASLLLSAAAMHSLLTGNRTPSPLSVTASATLAAKPASAEPASSSATAAAPTEAAVPPGSTAVAMLNPAMPAPTSAGPASPSIADSDIVLRVHGSNTVGEKLSPALIDAFLHSKGATQVVTEAGASPEEKALITRLPGRTRAVAVEVHAHGSTTAFADLASGSADLGQSSRRIKDEEVAALKDKHGDLSKPGSEYVVALDGLAIIVHPRNRLANLSIEQIAKIFAGKVKDWSELGEQAGPIAIYARDDASGTWDTFKNLVLAPNGLALDPAAHRIESSSDLSDAVAADVHGIGFIGLPYVRRSKLLAVSAEEKGFALVPTPFTVGTEDYPLSRRLYFYAPADSSNGLMREFIDFALSDAGQDVVKREGFVSQNVTPEAPHIEGTAPAEYRSAADGAERLSLNFRFQPGSEELDAKALRDLDRIVTFLAKNSGREISLLGFTDDRGNAHTNLALSKKRAAVVAEALEARGVYTHGVHGFGAVLPVASNATEEARNRNRRVEVWIR